MADSNQPILRPAPSTFLETAHRYVGSHDRPAMLFDWVFGGRLTDPVEIAEAVADTWSGAKIPFASLGVATWIELFRMGGYTVDGIPSDRPTEPVTLYRAAEPSRVHRLAWTGSLDVAQRFLEINRRYGDRPRFIYTITVDPERLLAHINDRQEDEYVTDTRGLKAKRWEQA